MSIRALPYVLARIGKEKEQKEVEKFSLGDLDGQIKQAERNIDILKNKTRMNSNTKEKSIKYWHIKRERLIIMKGLKLKFESKKQDKDNSIQTKEG